MKLYTQVCCHAYIQYVYINIHVYIYIHIYIYVYAYMYLCIYVYVYVKKASRGRSLATCSAGSARNCTFCFVRGSVLGAGPLRSRLSGLGLSGLGIGFRV